MVQLAHSIDNFRQRVQDCVATVTFEQRRALMELLIDCVVFTDGDLEIRYVLPTVAGGPYRRFYQLVTECRGGVSEGLGDIRGGAGERRPAHREVYNAKQLHAALGYPWRRI